MVTPALSYPGVYVQEVPSGVRTIVGVSTSVAIFLGTAKKGPIFKPVRCLNYTSFVDRFGDDASAGQLAQYVRLFFLNGGTDCWVMRIAEGASAASVTLNSGCVLSVLSASAALRGPPSGYLSDASSSGLVNSSTLARLPAQAMPRSRMAR